MAPIHVTLIDSSSSYLNQLQPGDTIALQAGQRDYLTIRNIYGTPNAPITIINHDGIVNIKSNHYFGLSISNCHFIRITGTGTQDKYGLKIEDILGSGVGIGYGSSDFEIDHVEIHNVEGSGMLIKTNATCTDWHKDEFTQYNIRIHDNFVTHSGKEGFYVGTTLVNGKTLNCNGTDTLIFDPLMENVWVYDNIVDHSGWDGIQVSSATNAHIYNNFVAYNSTEQRNFQKSGLFLGGGFEGRAYNNIVKEGWGNGIGYFGNGNSYIYNNQFIRSMGEYGLFMNDIVADSNASNFYFVNNLIVSSTISGIHLMLSKFEGDDIVIANNAIYDPGYLSIYEQQNQALKAYINSNGVNITAVSNYFRPEVIADDYVNSAFDDYNLTYHSAMVDQGKKFNALNFMTYDCDGDLRYQGNFIDVGPQESSFSSSTEKRLDSRSFSVSLPVPIQEPIVKAVFKTEKSRPVDIYLVNMEGKTHTLFKDFAVPTGETTKEMDLSRFDAGIYILKVTHKADTLYTKKVVLIR